LIRLGLLGGTFDPPHFGHLLMANEAAWQLRLERVLFLPAQQNPLKRGEPSSPAEARCEMVELAIADNPSFELSRLDVDRPPPSYTVDLLGALAAPDRELFFLAGGDILPELPHWHAPVEILRLARLVIATRPGAPAPNVAHLEHELPGIGARVDVIRTPGLEISSTQLRDRVRAGKPIRYLTPASVEQYIVENRLYR
jgi:nicotinate-nucleotide adenylyltransferase